MTAHIRDGGGFQRTWSAAHIRDGGGFQRSWVRAHVRDGGGFQRVWFDSSSAPGAASPAFVRGTGRSNSPITITTANSTAAGGVSYLWNLISDTGGTWDAVYPNDASTQFRCLGVASGESFSAVFTCTITDASGNVTTSNNVTASVNNLGGTA